MSVVVFAVPERESHSWCFASIEASDIGKRYTVMRHPPGIPAWEHWRRTHLFAANMPTDLVIVLEDDVLVNRHILWNVQSWRWPHHREFQAGWLFNAGGYSGKDVWYEGLRNWYGTVGVVYRTRDLVDLVERAWEMRDQCPWDEAISTAANGFGRIRVHYPSLVEHPDEAPSVVGSERVGGMRTSRGTFDLEWRRPERHEHGLVDEFGREVAL